MPHCLSFLGVSSNNMRSTLFVNDINYYFDFTTQDVASREYARQSEVMPTVLKQYKPVAIHKT